jgi:flagella basal body P-ring formation protein FlgA
MLPMKPSFSLLLAAVILTAHAESTSERQRLDVIDAAVRSYLGQQLADYGPRARIDVGRLDHRLNLKPCDQLTVQLPAGNRLVGNSSVQVRCAKPGGWTIAVPVAISIETEYWVATRALPAGHELTEADLERRTGDLAQLPAAVITDRAQAVGRTVVGGVAAGAPLRSDLLRAPFLVRANTPVRVLARGSGFEVSSEGRALANAGEGQPVSVRMVSGSVVQGVVRADGAVEIRY